MTTNTELLLDIVKNFLHTEIKDLDNCVHLNGQSDCDHIFYNKASDMVSQVSYSDHPLLLYSYNFYDAVAVILKTKTSNKFLCVYWTIDELEVLRYKMNEAGLQRYKIEKIDFVDEDELFLHNLSFEDDSDAAVFEMYFHALFSNEEQVKKDYFRRYDVIKKHELLK
jgi:hypothetical protein